MLEGEYLMHVPEGRQVCPPGTFVYVPRGTSHTFEVVSTGPGRKLNLFTPAAMVGFFEELAAAEAAGTRRRRSWTGSPPQPMEVVGPVPDSYL